MQKRNHLFAYLVLSFALICLNAIATLSGFYQTGEPVPGDLLADNLYSSGYCYPDWPENRYPVPLTVWIRSSF